MVKWEKLRQADQELWSFVSAKCERGTKAKPGEQTTQFETFFKEGMFDMTVRQHLMFLPSGSSSSQGKQSDASNAIAKLQSEMGSLSAAVRGLKRPYDQQQPRQSKGGKGRGKGGNASRRSGKRDPKGKPKELAGYECRDHGANICWNYNLVVGCPLANPGGSCPKGKHVCVKCKGNHSLVNCPR